jgi:ferredoxin--NADP+ reductase
MNSLTAERVLAVHHWNDQVFSFTTTRNGSFRFVNGQFVMMGLELGGSPILRAFSLVNTSYDEELEFYSIKIQSGALTSRLQHVAPGDSVLVGRKPTGTLVIGNLRPGKRLWLLATGTGLAPFMSIVRDPETYERFDTVILAHSVRRVSDLGYRRYIEQLLPRHELVGDDVRRKLIYYPTVTREPFRSQGRLTTLLETGRLCADVGCGPLTPEHDRVMLCGNPQMLADLTKHLETCGFEAGSSGEPGTYLYERAFVSR